MPFRVVRLKLKKGPALAERARAGRYRLLEKERERRGAKWVALAHHADDQAETVLLNLLRNAIEAMEAAAPAAPRRIEVNIACVAPEWVSVQVADHGPGIAEGELEQVFEAFHSTKPLGLGVGLAICRRLIEAQGGTLRAAQNPAGGALFEFTLPVAPAESA